MAFTPLTTAHQAQWHHGKRSMSAKGATAAQTSSLVNTLRNYWYWGETRVTSSIVFALLVGHYVFQLPGFAPFVELQHPIPTEELKDPNGGHVINEATMTFTIAATMQWLLRPLAISQGVRAPAKQQRFMEQGWLVVFYSISWTAGMWIMYNSKHWFNTDEMWREYPFYQLTPSMNIII
ncbi:hypothetical protein BDF19DRAFT_421431 [Syncephalis fuscata]|nr:hypothetical protein BDF19DRAFT_421431 [Syncephalis fuscata]